MFKENMPRFLGVFCLKIRELKIRGSIKVFIWCFIFYQSFHAVLRLCDMTKGRKTNQHFNLGQASALSLDAISGRTKLKSRPIKKNVIWVLHPSSCPIIGVPRDQGEHVAENIKKKTVEAPNFIMKTCWVLTLCVFP